jgi:hypothetical protein
MAHHAGRLPGRSGLHLPSLDVRARMRNARREKENSQKDTKQELGSTFGPEFSSKLFRKSCLLVHLRVTLFALRSVSNQDRAQNCLTRKKPPLSKEVYGDVVVPRLHV